MNDIDHIPLLRTAKDRNSFLAKKDWNFDALKEGKDCRSFFPLLRFEP